MPVYPPALTDAGLSMPRTSDYLTAARDYFEAETGTTPDWDRDTLLGLTYAELADQLGTVSEIVQAVYDSRRRENATGVQLDDLGMLIDVARDPASYSTARVQFMGTAGTFLRLGTQVEGGGSDGRARWATTADYTLTGIPATDTLLCVCTVAGATTALIGQIDAIVTPITGLSSVTNLVAATPGTDREDDGTYRRRQEASLQISGTASVNAIRSKLVALDYIEAAVVQENDDGVTQTINGLSMLGHSVAVVLYPSGLTTAQESEVATTIYENTPAGTYLHGTTTKTVTKADGVSKMVRWFYASDDPCDVIYVLTMNTGWAVADVHDDLVALVTTYFAGLEVGRDVTLLDLQGLAVSIIDENTGLPKIRTLTTLTVNGAATDHTVLATAKATLNTVSVT